MNIQREKTKCYSAISVPNLENIEELVADGTVVASDEFLEEAGRQNIEGQTPELHSEEKNDRIPFYFYPTNSLVRQIKSRQRPPSTFEVGQNETTVLRGNPGRRADLGSVGQKCFSWSGAPTDTEGDNMGFMVGRKGGMI